MRPAPLLIAVLVCGPPALAKEQSAFLRLVVNSVEKGDAMAVLQEKDVLMKADDLSAAGLRDLAGRREQRSGAQWISLASLAPGVRYQIDAKTAALQLTADPAHLRPTALDLGDSARPAEMVFAPASSLFLNYAARTANAARPTGYGEAGLSIGTALLYSGASVGDGGTFVRGMSNLTFDDPGRLRRLMLGDVFAGSGALGSGATVLGLGFGREMSLDPYFVAAPHEDLRGATATPSQVEIYDGDRLVRTETLAPGPFELRNVQGYGATTRVVVRDAFGRGQEFAVGTRSTAALLAPGLTDFAYQIGLRRADLSQSFAYGAPAFYARQRIGVTSFLTMGARGEASLDTASGGPTLTASTPLGNFDLSAAGSRSGQSSGAATWASYGISMRWLALGTEVTWMSPRFSNLTIAPETDRPRLALRLLASTSLGGSFSLSGGYNAAFMRDGGLQRVISGSASMRLGDHFNLFAQASMEPARTETMSAFVGLTFMLGRSNTTASVQQTQGQSTPALVSQMPLPVGSGVGYTLRTQGGPAPQASLEAQGQGPYGLYQASFGRSANSQTWTASAAGALIVVDGAVFATRPVQQGFALVQVPGARDVRVYLNNQEMGRTDSGGRLLLPDVMPYYGNRFRIADGDLPFDYGLSAPERLVAGPQRGAALARFDAHRVMAFTGRALVSGAPARQGSALLVDGKRFPVGLDGRFYLENVAPGRRVAELEGQGAHCKLTLDLIESKLPVREVGSVGCAGGALAGRLFVDENGDGRYQQGEPLLDGVNLKVGGKRVTTAEGGRYSVADASSEEVSPADSLEMPAGFTIGASASGDLAVHKPKPLRDLGAALVLDLPGGPVRMMQIQAATIPLQTWLAGRGLTQAQDAAIQGLGNDVLDAKDLRVLVVVHPAQGESRWSESLKGARAALRYLKGPALVPPARLIWTMAEPGSGEAQGSVDILLVRVPR